MPSVEADAQNKKEYSVMSSEQSKSPDEFLIWGVSLVVGCAFLYCLPKLLLVLVIGGLVLGFVSMD